ncbi:hypothetical protein K6485_18865 [Escherichia ruysiae]|nr:hypothetical protein [Escherichia ruysiae]MBY7366821.1 hypothetical protein [Escherichia coli]MBY7621696.1 hypothetical protein [Escherichia marmotae]MBY7193524.1 hypothetical protein [Escherichia ruysiae]MBY7220589.1 hypothetical protein [Escherichia ruysiae]
MIYRELDRALAIL